jgi:hypothetical protein|tara:strand:+ start:257 stop:745 length:489 start_codon:yes stop_codon:yes gene_type:complete
MRKLDYLFDVDGTLLDITHRLKFIREKPKNWKAFRDPRQKNWDEPIIPIINIFNALRAAGHNTIIVTARTKDEEEDTRKTLVNWIPGMLDPTEDMDYVIPMYLRSFRDYRKDTVVKAEILEKVRMDGYKPEMVFDDRPSVINMWHEQGLIVGDVRDPSKGEF